MNKSQQTLPYDPKLRDAAEEIRAVFAKYDVLGTCAMASPTHSELIFQPEATWSLVRWEGVGPERMGLRFRSKREDFESKEAQDQATTATIHAIESVRWLSERFARDMEKLIDMVRKSAVVMTNVAGFMGRPDSYPGDGK